MNHIDGLHGRITARDMERLKARNGFDTDTLMTALLPRAQAYAVVPLSGFRVGAVVRARMGDGKKALFFGANMEFRGLPLTQTLHAEQVAVIRAWQSGGGAIEAVAVTAMPCGYCRQLLYEFDPSGSLKILVRGNKKKVSESTLKTFLPEAFGPGNLQQNGVFGGNAETVRLDGSKLPETREVRMALRAAEQSYAPYTHTRSGCVIVLKNGACFAGRYLESAAFNPGISPLQAALVEVVFSVAALPDDVSRVIVVEQKGRISQKAALKYMANIIFPDAKWAHYETKAVKEN